MCSNYCIFRLAQLMHVVVYLLIVYGLLRYFKRNSWDGSLLNPTGLLATRIPSHANLPAKTEVQGKSDKEST